MKFFIYLFESFIKSKDQDPEPGPGGQLIRDPLAGSRASDLLQRKSKEFCLEIAFFQRQPLFMAPAVENKTHRSKN
jgi:hypothetical protein